MKFIYQDHSLKSGIYKILNTHTNRIYVGQAKEFKERWKNHKRSLLNKNHQNRFIQSDFNKCREELGHDDFLEFHVLEVLDNSTKEIRSAREEHWIAQWFDGGKQCYNLTLKAVSREGKPSKTPEETRIKQSIALKGRVKTQEEKKKLSALAKERWANPEYKAKYLPIFQENSMAKKARMIGLRGPIISEDGKRRIAEANKTRVISDATRLKCSIASTGKKHSLEVRQRISKNQPKKRAVLQFSLDGAVIARYTSIHEAARYHKSTASNISACCRGIRKTVKGYIWKYDI